MTAAVRQHPQGGYTIARPIAPESSVRLYEGHFATVAAAQEAIAQRLANPSSPPPRPPRHPL